MEAGQNQYAAMTGLQTLKERIAEKIARFMARNMIPVAKCWSRPAPAKGCTRR
jgi:hypothetical protein